MRVLLTYALYENDERTEKTARVYKRDGEVIKNEVPTTGNWFLVGNRYTGSSARFKAKLKKMQMAKDFFGIQNPPHVAPSEMVELVRADGSVERVKVERKRGKRAKYTWTKETLEGLAAEILAAGMNLRTYLKSKDRMAEYSSAYVTAHKLGVVMSVRKFGQRGKTSKYSEDEMKTIQAAILESKLTFADWIKREKRDAEKPALYVRLRELGLEVPQGKKGFKKGWNKS